MASQNQPTVSTYAEKTKKRIQPITTIENPSDEQGIIFNHTGEHTIRDYLLALSDQVGGPQNIIAASRVSGSKVIVFLKNKALVDDFQSKKGGFQLGPLFFPTKKLKPPTTKLLISNISPTIPNNLLEELLVNTLQLKLLSPITYLRVNPNDDVFGHIISWRRQVHISSKFDSTKIPPTTEIVYNSHTYRIFFSADNLACFKWGNQGHKAEDCPQIYDPSSNNLLLHQEPPIAPQTGTEVESATVIPPLPKRAASSPESTVVSNEQHSSTTANAQPQVSSTPHVNKKIRVEPPSHSTEALANANANAQSPSTPPDLPPLTQEQLADQLKPLYADPKNKPSITIENLAAYIDTCKNPSKDAAPNLLKYNLRPNQMVPILRRSHSLIQNTKSKGRITRIVTALSPPPPATPPT